MSEDSHKVSQTDTPSSPQAPSLTKLSVRDTIMVGVALFTMFFGAGNLIFPPMLPFNAGSATPLAFIGFIISAIGLPVLGVVAVAKSKDLPTLASKIHPLFSTIFILLVVLAIGPMLAIPRTSSTSFSMVAAPFLTPESLPLVQLGYSVVFFAIAFALALKPNRITQFLGKVSGPVLLALIVVMVIGALVHPLPADPNLETSAAYSGAPLIAGFLEGYQTMDALAALLFGVIITMNVARMGVTRPSDQARITSIAGVIMGIVEALVYLGLCYVGFWASGLIAQGTPDVTGATILTTAAQSMFGQVGVAIIGIIFVLACLNVCTGLLCTVSEHFTNTFPKISYRVWLIAFTVVSLGLSNFGLAAILKISVPILMALYPVAIVLIIMGLLHQFVQGHELIWKFTVGFTTVAAVAFSLGDVVFPAGSSPLNALPLASVGLGWIIPAVIGFVLGFLVFVTTQKNKAQ